jgi:tRNA-Thr(GGU) m(6)t(6)A37 methyltransferase TsaA
MNIHLKPIAYIKNKRIEPDDDHWEEVISEIELAPEVPLEAFDNIELFSHLEVIYHFNKVKQEDIVFARHPRGNKAYPRMGIFSQRNSNRPNSIGLATVELLEHQQRKIRVRYLDAIDGTPVLDIKPVFKEFQPNKETTQPDWVADLTKHYWK